MLRLRNAILALVFGSLLVMALGFLEAGTSTNYTCLLCRLGRVDTTWFGLTHSTFHENECSHWYPENVEPSHVHLWEPGTCVTLLNGFAQPIGVGCRPGQYPIRLLYPSTQLHVYQHFQDLGKAKGLFSGLADERSHDDRLDEHDQSRGHLIVESNRECEAAGFPDTWDDWWGRWWDKHVAEHQEWLAWLHSDSHMSFWEWKDRQKAVPPPGDREGQAIGHDR
jgi:hypothetical protein